MLKAPIPNSELERLNTLYDYHLLDTSQEDQLDEITQTAAHVCECEISWIGLLDKDRQWFISKKGFSRDQIPREISYSGHAIMSDDIFIVEDSELDDRFRDNPLFLGEPFIRFFAGAPLIAPNGERIGALCVIDSKVKKLNEKQKLILKALAKQIITIFEFKKIILKLKKNEILLNETQKNAHIGGWELNVKTLELAWTNETYRIHGIEIGTPLHSEDEINFYAEDEKKKIDHFYRNCIEKGISFESSFEFISAKGQKKWVHLKAFPEKNSDGEVIKVYGTIQDITEEKIKEIKLESTNQYLNLALSVSGLGIWDWYLTNDIVKFDKRWAEMIGLNIDDIPMELSTWKSRVHPDDIEQCYADIEAYMNGKTNYYENIHRMKHKNGKWIYTLDRGKFTAWDKSGRPTRFTGAQLDITDTKEKEKELSLILESNSIGIWKYNPIDNVLSWDKSMYNLYEMDQKNFSGDFDAWAKSLHPDYLEKSQKEFQDALEGKIPFDTTFAIITPKKKIKFMKAKAMIERDQEGKAVMVTGVNTDITKEHEAMLELSNQTKIAQHHAKLASIGELAAGVGHEINNPLSIIKGYLSAIEKKKDKGHIRLDDLESYVEKINVATNRIERIVQGLRAFSRSDSSEIAIFSPLEAIEESFNMVKEIYEKDGIHITFKKGTDKDYIIRGNRGKFQQVMMNLISNARDATSGQETRFVHLSLTDQDNILIIKIKDNGCGVPDSLKEKIFDPFFTTKEINKGTGIGLSVVHNFIKEMNGSIHVDSKINKGSTFTVKLPVLSTAEAQKLEQRDTPLSLTSKLSPSKENQLSKRPTALVAEDEDDIREILTGIIEEMGLDVTAVKNGKVAYDLYIKNPDKFDIIISDIKMPEMDGPTLIKNIRSRHDIKQPKFTIITGGMNINFKDKESELSKLIDGYFFKPFDEQKIFEILKRCLGSKMDNVA